LTEVVVSIAPGASATAVADALARAGLRDGQVLEAAGIVTGSADDPEALRGVDGVEAVEAARSIQIPPPDAPIS